MTASALQRVLAALILSQKTAAAATALFRNHDAVAGEMPRPGAAKEMKCDSQRLRRLSLLRA